MLLEVGHLLGTRVEPERSDDRFHNVPRVLVLHVWSERRAHIIAPRRRDTVTVRHRCENVCVEVEVVAGDEERKRTTN
jgi:hypothetical protein